uniref:Uncharacterized protein n=1 Tax=Cannabis sativa TaxID=3483 RepID=A0A803QY43_CANSA
MHRGNIVWYANNLKVRLLTTCFSFLIYLFFVYFCIAPEQRKFIIYSNCRLFNINLWREDRFFKDLDLYTGHDSLCIFSLAMTIDYN